MGFVNWNKLAFALLFGLPVMCLVIMMRFSRLPEDYQAGERPCRFYSPAFKLGLSNPLMELKQRCIEAGYTKVSSKD